MNCNYISRRTRITFLVLLVTLSVLYNIENLSIASSFSSGSKSDPTIVFALVSCDPPGTNRLLPLTVSLLHSIVLSARLSNISEVRVHIFLESMEKQYEIYNTIMETCFETCRDLLQLKFHSVLDAVPKKYLNSMIFINPYRCSYVRLFLSKLLPKEDAIIYLDLDTLITGNLHTIWNEIHKFKETEVIGAAQSAERGQTDLAFFKPHFSDIPYVPPFGINSGVLLMNLTRMREIDWNGKIFETYDNYSKVTHMRYDQRPLNILLHFEPELLRQISCKFNYMHGMCDHGQMCKEAEVDPEGVQIIHGSGGQIEIKGWQFYELGRIYREFNFNSSLHNITAGLFHPIRKYYRKRRGRGFSQCYPSLHRILFKQYFT